MKKQNLLTRRVTLALAALAAAGGLSACAPGFEMTPAGREAAKLASGGGSDTNGGSGSTADWSTISMDGAINGGSFDKTQVVGIDKDNKALVIRLPFIPGILLGAQASIPVPQVPGASIGIEEGNGATALVLRIPLEKVLRGVDTLPKGRLPNGDALPAIPEGELPSVGVSVDRGGKLKGALYLSPTVVGLFVTTKFNPYIRLTLPIRNEARTVTYGYFTTIPEKNGFDGGFFLSIALPSDLARAIDDLL